MNVAAKQVSLIDYYYLIFNLSIPQIYRQSLQLRELNKLFTSFQKVNISSFNHIFGLHIAFTKSLLFNSPVYADASFFLSM